MIKRSLKLCVQFQVVPQPTPLQLGPKSGASLRDAAKGIDTRAWEARPPRRSVGAQVTWGVRFVEPAEAAAFIEKLAAEVSDRMRKLKLRGRTVTLKVLRAVANAPEQLMKGCIGHGVCDHLTRSVTLNTSTDNATTLQRQAVRLLARRCRFTPGSPHVDPRLTPC